MFLFNILFWLDIVIKWAEREKVRQRGSGAESQAGALGANQGLHNQN